VPSFEVRLATPNDAYGIAEVKIAGWRDAYTSILPPDVLKNLNIDREAQKWHERLTNWSPDEPAWVAADQETVIGFIVAGANRYPAVPCDAELQAIYVHPSAQRRGVGEALLSEGVAWLLQHGYQKMAVFVFRDNSGGRGFYEALGASHFDSGVYEVAGKSYADESYMWDSLHSLQDILTRRSRAHR
jgi:ribosomal protein S18 acetylase RimI-like enzyme